MKRTEAVKEKRKRREELLLEREIIDREIAEATLGLLLLILVVWFRFRD